METKRYPLTEEIDGVDGYVEISKGRQKFVMEDGKKLHLQHSYHMAWMRFSSRIHWKRLEIRPSYIVGD